MPLVFYPPHAESALGGLDERLEVLMDAASRYRAVALDVSSKAESSEVSDVTGFKQMVPRDIKASYNWDEIALILRQIRDLPEGNKADKELKAALLMKLAEIYEVLRAAKMSKLEAVRLALINEAAQLRGGGSQQVA